MIKEQTLFIKELCQIYSAPSEEAGLMAFSKLEVNWGKKYHVTTRTWRLFKELIT